MAGQECPLYEVPGPNSKRANNFTRDFLQVSRNSRLAAVVDPDSQNPEAQPGFLLSLDVDPVEFHVLHEKMRKKYSV